MPAASDPVTFGDVAIVAGAVVGVALLAAAAVAMRWVAAGCVGSGERSRPCAR